MMRMQRASRLVIAGVVGGLLLAGAPAMVGAEGVVPVVSMASLAAPAPLPANHRHLTIELTFGEPDESDEGSAAPDDDVIGEADEAPAPVGDDSAPEPASPFPFSFTLGLGIGHFEPTSIVATPGLACVGGRVEYDCSVERPGTFVISVSGPENGPTIGCSLWAEVRTLDGVLLARLGNGSYDCTGWPIPPTTDEDEGVDDVVQSPVDDSLPNPVPLDTLPATGTSPATALVAALVLALGVALTWLSRRDRHVA